MANFQWRQTGGFPDEKFSYLKYNLVRDGKDIFTGLTQDQKELFEQIAKDIKEGSEIPTEVALVARGTQIQENLWETRAAIRGRVHELVLKEGNRVEQGEPVLTVEAMMMYNPIRAPIAGIINKLYVVPDQILQLNEGLFEIKTA